LPDDAILIEWFRYSPFDPQKKTETDGGDGRYVAYLLKHFGDPEVVDLGPAQPIEDLVAELRTALSDPNNSYFSDVAQDLSEKLIRPLRLDHIQSGHLILSPDGALNLVPFAALLDERGEYLIHHFEITYLTSGRDLFRMGAHSPVRSGSVILANPDFGQSARAASAPLTHTPATRSAAFDRGALSFTPLPGTAVEAEVLRSLLKLDARNVFTGGDASKATLRDLRGPMILHLATHGFFLDDQEIAAMSLKALSSESKSMPGENSMLRSGLALAGANAPQLGDNDDGILTAAETAKLDLLGTQLVVLSACETGVGTIRTGEGVYGLRRALVLAGSQAQLTSLWKVSDAGTQELMADYYRRLLKGQGRSQALRLAQQTMLAKPARRHPYYWAAFIPVGNWAPLTTK
jgi:CHAT domain-containing protein